MKEITRIVTVEITSIEKMTNAEYEIYNSISPEAQKKFLTNGISKAIKCDNVNVVNIQNFVRDNA